MGLQPTGTKLTFNGGTITTPLNAAPGSNAVNDLLLVTEPVNYAALGPTGNVVRATDGVTDVLLIDAYGGVFTTAPVGQSSAQYRLVGADAKSITLDTTAGLSLASGQAINAGRGTFAGGIATTAITSGALATQQLVSATGAQIITTRDAQTITPVTFNPTAGAAATCVVALSPDNTTYSTAGTETEPAGVALDGTIHLLSVPVPAGWYLKMTVANAVLGLTTKY